MSMNILNDISQVYMEKVASKPDFLDLDKDGNKKEPMKKAAVEAPKERLKTDRDMFNIPKDEQKAARERLLAKARSKREKMKESLDPVGQEDDDIDNDGDTDSSDKYLHKRRKVIGNAISKKKSVKESSDYDPMDDDEFDHDEAEENRGVSGKNNPKGGKSLVKKKKPVKEGFSNWRQDLSEVMDEVEASKEVKEKKVNNKIKINPEIKEAVEQLGGELIEMVELDEKSYRGLGVGRVERVSSGSYKAPETTGASAKRKPKTETKPVENKKPASLPPEQGRRAKKRRAGSPSYDEVKAQIDAKEKSRKPKKSRNALDKLLSSIRNEEFELDEKTLTSAETKKKEEIVKSMKKSSGDFEKRYPGRGKEVMYATATKMAKKVAEDVEQIDERRREDKGTPRPQRDRALEVVKGMIRQQTGTPSGQRKKVPGKKPPTAGEYGAPKSPAQKLKLRKAQQQRSQDWQQDTKGT